MTAALAILHAFAGYVAILVVALLLFGRIRRGEVNVSSEDDDAEHVAVTIGSLLGVLVVLLAFLAGVLSLILKVS